MDRSNISLTLLGYTLPVFTTRPVNTSREHGCRHAEHPFTSRVGKPYYSRNEHGPRVRTLSVDIHRPWTRVSNTSVIMDTRVRGPIHTTREHGPSTRPVNR